MKFSGPSHCLDGIYLSLLPKKVFKINILEPGINFAAIKVTIKFNKTRQFVWMWEKNENTEYQAKSD